MATMPKIPIRSSRRTMCLGMDLQTPGRGSIDCAGYYQPGTASFIDLYQPACSVAREYRIVEVRVPPPANPLAKHEFSPSQRPDGPRRSAPVPGFTTAPK